MKRTIDHLDVRGQRVLVRLDLNVPMEDGRISDDRRIRAALPTIKKLVEDGGRVILMSHLGRPEGDPQAKTKYTLAPVAKRISELLGKPARFVDEVVGEKVAGAARELRDGEVMVIENLRFREEEQIKDKKAASDPALKQRKESFAQQLADLADVYVNDAFGTCHRDNASMLTVPQLMKGKPKVTGPLVQKELKFLGEALRNPKRPFVCLLGGAKVSDKLGVIQSLLDKCDAVLIGGAMAFTFLAAEGMNVGRSLVEQDLLDTARELKRKAGDKLRLPRDFVVASEIKEGAAACVAEGSIAADMMGLDIGPKTIEEYRRILQDAGTIFWNGPMGVFETAPFDQGTRAMAKALAIATDRGAVTIVGGGDSAAAIEQAGLAERISHISTGGGASLEFLEGKSFAPLEVLDKA